MQCNDGDTVLITGRDRRRFSSAVNQLEAAARYLYVIVVCIVRYVCCILAYISAVHCVRGAIHLQADDPLLKDYKEVLQMPYGGAPKNNWKKN